MNDKFKLDKHGEPVPCADLTEWATWFGTAERRVSHTVLPEGRISTVFLGLDMGNRFRGEPVLWETMVFGGPLNYEVDRCSGSREQAEAMHERMVKRVKEAGT